MSNGSNKNNQSYIPNSFEKSFQDYLNTYKPIRRCMGLEDRIETCQSFRYDVYLSSNDDIKKTIKEHMLMQGNSFLLLAPTGSGKSYTLIESMNEIMDESERPILSIKLNPKSKQTQQESRYRNVSSYYGSIPFDIKNINKIWSVVYDKSLSLQNFLRENDIGNTHHIVLCLDEAHALVSHQYRSLALKYLRSLIDYVLSMGGSVCYTTGTFNNTVVLPIDHIIFCNPTKYSNISRIEEYTCPSGVKKQDFLLNCIKNAIGKGYVPVVRLNHIDLSDNIKRNLEATTNLKVFTINSTNQATSEAAKSIVESSILPYGDCYLVTCLLDEATNIIGRMNEKGQIEQNPKLCPIFFIDPQNCNFDNILQFFSRIRHPVETGIVLVDKHEFNDGSVTPLLDIVKENSKSILEEFESFKLSLVAAKLRYKEHKKAIGIEMNFILNQWSFMGPDKRNHRGHVFSYDEDVCEVRYDVNAYFDNLYNKWMLQYFTHDNERRNILRQMFDCKVIYKKYEPDDNKAELVDYTAHEFDRFCEEIKSKNDFKGNDLEDFVKTVENAQDFAQYAYIGIDADIKKVKEDKRFENLIALSKYEKVEEAAIDIKTMKSNEVKTKIREFQRNDVIELGKNEIEELRMLLMKEISMIDIKSTRVKNIAGGDYMKLLEMAVSSGITIQNFITLSATREYKKLEDYIILHQIIRNNRRIIDGENILPNNLAGRSGFEQKIVIEKIEELKQKNETDSITLSDDNIQEIKKCLSKESPTKKWTTIGVKKFIKMIYKFEERGKNKKINVLGLRQRH